MGIVQVLRCIRTEQIVCFHRHGSEAAHRCRQGCGKMLFAMNNLSTRRTIPGWIQKQASVNTAFFPCRARKSLPVKDVGCGPCGQSLAAPVPMESRPGWRGQHDRSMRPQVRPRASMRRDRSLVECPYLPLYAVDCGAERVHSVGNRTGCKLGSDTETFCLCGYRDGGTYGMSSSAEAGRTIQRNLLPTRSTSCAEKWLPTVPRRAKSR